MTNSHSTTSATADAPVNQSSAKPRFAAIALTNLRPSPHNPRRIAEDDPTIVELASSLASPVGQIEPIVVRASGEPGIFEILAGERRFVAAKLAKLSVLEAKVVDVDQTVAMDITVIENLQRADLTPLEEARGVKSLLDSGRTPEQIAGRLGKPATWVAKRAQLTALIPAWLKLSQEHDLPISHLEQIARLPEQIQTDFAEDVQDKPWQLNKSAKELATYIEEHFLHTLKSAAWKLDASDLVPTAGACTVCPKRSSCQQTLFSDVAGKNDRCLDATCWNAKAQAQTMLQANKIAATADKVLVLTQRNDGAPAPAADTLPANAVVAENTWAIKEAKKSEPGAVPTINCNTGKTGWAVITQAADPEVRKAFGIKDARSTFSGDNQVSNAEVEANRREAKRIKARFAAIVTKLGTMPEPELPDLLRLVRTFLIQHSSLTDAGAWKEATKELDTAAIASDLWSDLRTRLEDIQHGQVLSTNLPDPKAVAAFEAWVGLNPKEQTAQALIDLPEPKPKSGKIVQSDKMAKPVTIAKRSKPTGKKIRKAG